VGLLPPVAQLKIAMRQEEPDKCNRSASMVLRKMFNNFLCIKEQQNLSGKLTCQENLSTARNTQLTALRRIEIWNK
jgi:hypothetical protein